MTASHPSDTLAFSLRAMQSCALFSQWPHDCLSTLCKTARTVHYPRRALVMSHDLHNRELLCVVTGRLEVSSLNVDGEKYIHAVVEPGSTLPLVRLLDEVQPLAYSYHASIESTVVHVSIESVMQQLTLNPILWRSVAELALRRQRKSMVLLHKQLLATHRQRLAGILIELSKTQSNKPHEPQQPVAINQSDLAAMVGVTRQTVNKELHAMARDGLISQRYGRITIQSFDQLENLTR